MFAIQVGQALLEYRIIHHLTDDAEFENSKTTLYTFVEHESEQAKKYHAILGGYVADPHKYHQGTVNLKGNSFFGEKWINAYAILDDPTTKPRMLRLYKRKHAASPPFAEFAIEECLCSMMECADCKLGWYCFTLHVRKGVTHRNVSITLCTDHSKKQESWLEALMQAGVEFEKEDVGKDLSNIKSIFELSAKGLNTDEIIPLSKYRPQVCLVVNVASK